MLTVPLVIAVVAGALAIYTLIQSRGTNLLAWAVLGLAVLHLI